jgi:hypothetical protein
VPTAQPVGGAAAREDAFTLNLLGCAQQKTRLGGFFVWRLQLSASCDGSPPRPARPRPAKPDRWALALRLLQAHGVVPPAAPTAEAPSPAAVRPDQAPRGQAEAPPRPPAVARQTHPAQECHPPSHPPSAPPAAGTAATARADCRFPQAAAMLARSWAPGTVAWDLGSDRQQPPVRAVEPRARQWPELATAPADSPQDLPDPRCRQPVRRAAERQASCLRRIRPCPPWQTAHHCPMNALRALEHQHQRHRNHVPLSPQAAPHRLAMRLRPPSSSRPTPGRSTAGPRRLQSLPVLHRPWSRGHGLRPPRGSRLRPHPGPPARRPAAQSPTPAPCAAVVAHPVPSGMPITPRQQVPGW